MNRIKLVAVMLMTATMVMSQTTKKSFTLNDLLGGGSTYWNLQPKYMFTAWWGEQPLELSVDKAECITANGSRGRVLFTTDDLNAILGSKVVRSCTGLTFPYADQPIVKVQTSKEIILIDFEKKAVT